MLRKLTGPACCFANLYIPLCVFIKYRLLKILYNKLFV